MDKNELERRLEAAEKQMLGLHDEIKNLKAKFAACDDGITDYPVFYRGEEYWRINEYGEIEHDGSSGAQIDYYDIFHNKEYAQLFANKCKLIAMMLHCKWYLDRDYVPDWNDNLEHKWQLYYDHDDKKMVLGNYSRSDYSVVFSTRESAQKCADWLNEHWKEDDNG